MFMFTFWCTSGKKSRLYLYSFMQILYCCEAHSLSSCLLSVERHFIYFYYFILYFSESPYAYIYSIFDIFKIYVSRGSLFLCQSVEVCLTSFWLTYLILHSLFFSFFWFLCEIWPGFALFNRSPCPKLCKNSSIYMFIFDFFFSCWSRLLFWFSNV